MIVVSIIQFVEMSIRALIFRANTDSTDWTIVLSEAADIITLIITLFRTDFNRNCNFNCLPIQWVQDEIDRLDKDRDRIFWLLVLSSISQNLNLVIHHISKLITFIQTNFRVKKLEVIIKLKSLNFKFAAFYHLCSFHINRNLNDYTENIIFRVMKLSIYLALGSKLTRSRLDFGQETWNFGLRFRYMFRLTLA